MTTKRVYTQASRTHQSFAKGVNIRTIAGRAFKGQPIPMRDGVAYYGDVSRFGDLQDAMHKVDAARAAFLQLPGPTRKALGHDPVQYCDLVELILADDPVARARGIDLGLCTATDEERKQMREDEIAKRKADLLSLDPTALDPDQEPVASG